MSENQSRSGFVSIAGRPNAGKSTLLNALVGEKIAITAYQPQTTRTSLQGILTKPGLQIVFVDTPGIHNSDSLFNKRMMDTVRGALQDRDLVLYVADATRSLTEEDAHAVAALSKSAKALLVLNKIDKISDKRLLLPLMQQYAALYPFAETVPVSAAKSQGLEHLLDIIARYLPSGPFIYPDDHITDQPLRYMAAEIVREAILHQVREEVPHAVAVLVDTWEETPKLVKIAATIHVERPGQKIIIIGKQGAMLKTIGTAARKRLEELLERKVFLSLFVSVKPDWRQDPSFLNILDWRAMLGSEDKP